MNGWCKQVELRAARLLRVLESCSLGVSCLGERERERERRGEDGRETRRARESEGEGGRRR